MSSSPGPESNGIFRVDFDDPAQIRKLKRIAADRGYLLVPGHDPVVWPALSAQLNGAQC
jgi:glyoxylase-like metal-dependent hydrolase (beta-lactamase superfamily II)